MEEEIETATLAKGTLWTFLAQAAIKLTSFVYLIVVARFFSPEDIGIFYFVMGLIGIVGIFADLGLLQSLPRYVPYLYGRGEFGKLRAFVKFLFVFGGILSLSFSVLLFLIAAPLSAALGKPEIRPCLEILSFLLLFNELIGLTSGLLIGRKLIKQTQLVSTLQGVVKLIFTIALAFYLGFNVFSLSYGFLISYIPLLAGYSYFVLKEINSWKKETTTLKSAEYVEFGKEVLSFGILLSIVTAFSVIATSVDRIMIGVLGGANAFAEVGIYSVVTSFAGLLLLPLSAVITIFFPMVSELFGKEKMEPIRKITSVAIKWSIILGAPLAILLLAFPDTFLRMFYGDAYAVGATVLILYLVGLFIFSLALLPLKVIAAMRRLDIELKISVAAAVVNVALNFLLIPLWGMNGSALATLISFTIMTLLAFWYSKKLFNFDFPKSSLLPLFSALLAFILLCLSRQYLLDLTAKIPIDWLAAQLGGIEPEMMQKMLKLIVFGVLFLVSCGLYFGILIASRSFGKEELEIVHKGMRRMKIPEKYIDFFLHFLGGKPGANAF